MRNKAFVSLENLSVAQILIPYQQPQHTQQVVPAFKVLEVLKTAVSNPYSPYCDRCMQALKGCQVAFYFPVV